jgi:hypothetical protein
MGCSPLAAGLMVPPPGVLSLDGTGGLDVGGRVRTGQRLLSRPCRGTRIPVRFMTG